MAKYAYKTSFTIGLLVLLMAVPALGASVNKSIKIDAGAESDGATTVNGSIRVGENAVVTGRLETVNGSIRIDDGAEIEDAETVNGRLQLGDGVRASNLSTVNGAVTLGKGTIVSGDIEAVNGAITVEKEAAVAGAVGNVNGRIELTGTEIGGNVSTVTGDVQVEQSVLKSDLVIEKPSFWSRVSNRKPRVVIGPGSRIEGSLVIEYEIELFVSDSAELGEVRGVMTLDDATRFSGDMP
jgi:DUF4097 and DUF4098 domain-containing protein YvlB